MEISIKENFVKEELLRPLKTGETVKGKVIGTGRSAVYFDLGPCGTGTVYGASFFDAKEMLKDIQEGDEIFVKVVSLENDEGYIELSLTKAREELSWDALRQKVSNNETITVEIEKANKGGLLASVSGITGFLPTSQLSPEHYPKVENADGTEILKRLQRLIGKELKVKILDLDPREGKLILSEKAGLSEKTRELLKNHETGEVVWCQITGIVDFGAFVKFPVNPEQGKEEAVEEEQLEGLIHISELDWQIIENPSDIVKVGEILQAKIVEITNNRVSLSLKALKEDPWKEVDKKYKKGDAVKGRVIKFNPFGAFIQIEPGIQGLSHISEFGTQNKMEEMFEIGKEYEFEILSVEPSQHRMSLKPKVEKS